MSTWMPPALRVAVTIAALLGAAPALGDEELTLGLGAQKVLTVEGLARFTVTPAATVVTVKNLGKGLLILTGSAAGTATIRAWTGAGKRLTYRIRVLHQDL